MSAPRHDGHDHALSHPHPPGAHPAGVPFSLLRLGVGARLMIVAVPLVVLWGLIAAVLAT